MKHVELGRTGLHLTAIGLGAMPLSLSGRPAEAQAMRTIAAYVELGGNFIDTANVYCLDDSDIGHNERLIGNALRQLGKTGAVVVASKGGVCRPKGDWVPNGDPAFLRRSCEASLEALGSDCIELYQLHTVDPAVGLLPSLQALQELQREGKIRHIGLSNVTQAQVETALQHVAVVSVQNHCNLWDKRDFSNGLVDWCGQQGITYIAHSPVGGHYDHAQRAGQPLLQELAKKHSASPYQIALAWLLAQGTHILPIPGASRPESIVSSWGAMDVRLDADDLAALN